MVFVGHLDGPPEKVGVPTPEEVTTPGGNERTNKENVKKRSGQPVQVCARVCCRTRRGLVSEMYHGGK